MAKWRGWSRSLRNKLRQLFPLQDHLDPGLTGSIGSPHPFWGTDPEFEGSRAGYTHEFCHFAGIRPVSAFNSLPVCHRLRP
jgi:hypothetical protein